MKCICGKKVETPFCAHCGKKMPDAPLQELLHHCMTVVRTKQVTMENAEWALAEDRFHDERARSRTLHTIESARKAIEKWGRWAEALANVVE